MTEFDRWLADLIQELTEHCVVWPLDMAVDTWGRERTKRVIADGFAVIRRHGANLDDASFIPTEESATVIDHVRATDDYVLMAGPWAPVDPEDEPDLVRRYASDDASAVDEVRRANAERRARLCP